MPTQLLTVDEVASRLSLEPCTVRKMIYRGDLPSIRPTKRAVRVSEEALEALILRGTQKPPRATKP
jgi:excisionase family DNA binding protein